MHIKTILEAFEKYKYPGIAFIFFFCRTPGISNKQPCLKTIGLYGDLLFLPSLFHFFYFIFSTPVSFICFPISPSFIIGVLSQLLIKHSRKACVYIHINNMYNICILENNNFCLAKNFMTFWFHLFDLVWMEC